MTEKANNAKDLLSKLKQEKSQVSEAKKELSDIAARKDELYKAKKAISSEIRRLISESKTSRTKRNKLTAEVKKLKEKRREFNTRIKDKIADIKEINKEKKSFAKTTGIRQDPTRIIKQIEKLEYKIETEALNFESEKKLMKLINTKRKELVDFKSVLDVFDEAAKLSHNIDIDKKEAERIHNEIQEKAAESQNIHERIIEISKELDILLVKEEELKDQYDEIRKKYADMTKGLKDDLGTLRLLKEKLEEISEEKKETKRKKVATIMKEKEKEVQEKIKNGEKLTTEDLLIFQKMHMTSN